MAASATWGDVDARGELVDDGPSWSAPPGPAAPPAPPLDADAEQALNAISKNKTRPRRGATDNFATMLVMRLGTLLLRDAIITLTQLEQSLRAQVLSGGLLGTNLVELGFIDLNTLGRYLARILDTPLAIADHLEKAEPKLIEAFGAVMADRFSAVPLRFEDDETNTVAVAMRDPKNEDHIAEISKHLNLKVRAYVTPELRLFYYLERYYGIRRRTRFTRAPEGEKKAPSSRRERRATQPFRGLNQPGAVNIAPKKDRDTPAASSAAALVETVCTFKDASISVDASVHRDDIAKSILRFSIGRFECAAVFTVRAGFAIGWLAQATGLGRDALQRLNLPLAAASVFQTAHDSKKPYRGPALTPGHPLEKELWSMMALDYKPSDIHVVPVCVRGGVVNLIYAHSASGSEAREAHASELIELASVAAKVYDRMVATSAMKE